MNETPRRSRCGWRLTTDAYQPSAAKTLGRWYVQRWLQRVGHGLYPLIPLNARAKDQLRRAAKALPS